MLTFGELNDRHAAILISVVLLLVVLIAILFVLSVVEKLSKRYIVMSGTFLMFEFACYFALYRCYYRIGVKGFPFIVYVVDNIPAILLIILTILVAVLTLSWIFFFIRWNNEDP